MDLTTRLLEEKDAATICTFVQSQEELFFFFPKAQYPLTPDQLVDGAGEREMPTVALMGDQVVGYANFIEVRPSLFCTLGNLVVDPSRRRRGVAAFLVQTMQQIASEAHGARFLRASCFSHNTAAYQLYHKLGFKPIGMAHRTSPSGEPVLLVHMEVKCRR